MALLSLQNASLRFGGIVALDDVSLEAQEGTIFGLIGPTDAGAIVFDGKALLHPPPSRVVKLGIARTFQNVELFPTMTVLENVLVGAHTVSRFKPERVVRQEALDTLELVSISAYARRPAAGLPFGTLKR